MIDRMEASNGYSPERIAKFHKILRISQHYRNTIREECCARESEAIPPAIPAAFTGWARRIRDAAGEGTEGGPALNRFSEIDNSRTNRRFLSYNLHSAKAYSQFSSAWSAAFSAIYQGCAAWG